MQCMSTDLYNKLLHADKLPMSKALYGIVRFLPKTDIKAYSDSS